MVDQNGLCIFCNVYVAASGVCLFIACKIVLYNVILNFTSPVNVNVWLAFLLFFFWYLLATINYLIGETNSTIGGNGNVIYNNFCHNIQAFRTGYCYC